MTKKEQGQALLDLAVLGERTRAERLAALDELIALAKASKTSAQKLTGTALDLGLLREEIEALLEADPLEEEPAKPEKAPTSLKEAEKVAEKAVEAKANERGQISAMVRTLLLTTDEPYSDIVAAVRAKHPKAVTTNRSVASVASELRSLKQNVPERRKAVK